MNDLGDMERVKESVRGSLDEVGRTKAVGYLPIHTITNVLSKTVAGWAQTLNERGLSVRILHEDKTCIKSGAMFAYDPTMVKKIIEHHKENLEDKGWKLDLDYIIEKISTEWYEKDNPIMPFIRELYNDDARFPNTSVPKPQKG